MGGGSILPTGGRNSSPWRWIRTCPWARYRQTGDLDEVSELLSWPKLRVVGLVIDKVGRIMRGMELGSAGMLGQIRQWARQGFMRDLLGLLQTQCFQVYLASDHGNIEARGVGRPAEGAVADLRRNVAAHVGRLLRLQGRAAASQVQRRVREQYRERDTVSRAARRVLRSFVDWEVLKETSEKGIYTAGLSLAIAQVEVIAWLAEAFLRANANGPACRSSGAGRSAALTGLSLDADEKKPF